MSVTLEKLRALRQQTGAASNVGDAGTSLPFSREREKVPEGRMRARDTAPPTQACFARPHPSPLPPAGEGAKSPADTITSLRRLLGVRERKVVPLPPRGPVDRTLPGEEIAPGLRLIESHLPYPAPATALSLAFAKRDGEAVDPRALLFFDTETTGLAGGTGTRAFMLGSAAWHRHPQRGDGLRIRQLLITTMSAEPAMLRTFAAWLRPDTVLVSYNGRSYDTPLLKARYRLARQGDPLAALDHLDLLHPTRRRYRGRWADCRLATVERELLRIVREDDLPGAQAPAAWLRYLRGGDARDLRRVLAHNRQDVISLARLLLRLVEVEAEIAAEAGRAAATRSHDHGAGPSRAASFTR